MACIGSVEASVAMLKQKTLGFLVHLDSMYLFPLTVLVGIAFAQSGIFSLGSGTLPHSDSSFALGYWNDTIYIMGMFCDMILGSRGVRAVYVQRACTEGNTPRDPDSVKSNHKYMIRGMAESETIYQIQFGFKHISRPRQRSTA